MVRDLFNPKTVVSDCVAGLTLGIESIPDAMASGAALLVKHGWQANQPWMDEVIVPAELPWEQADIAVGD